ncbi:MAG: tripartite tricarboxylate transporter substrate binding protein [Burkholderiaceae bacterium]|nr:MAG: tripartite tricarboxylate transporter substrate binding protein [Burkholderiaceae bacterium]
MSRRPGMARGTGRMKAVPPWARQRRRLVGAGAATLIAGASAARTAVAAAAAEPAPIAPWPQKPVRVVVPRAAAGTADVLARAVCEHLGREHGQRFVVDNQPDGAGVQALRRVVGAPADGHVLLASDAAVTLAAPLLQPGLAVDPVNELAHVVLMADAPLVLVAHPHGEVTTLRGLIDTGRPARTDLFCAVAGVGSHGHLVCEQLRSSTVADLTAVPYRGGAAALAAVLAREVPLGVAVLGSASALIAEGRLVALAVSSPRRVDVCPDVPTFAERGLPHLTIANWYGLSAPRGLAAPVAHALQAGVQRWLRSDAARALFSARAYQTMPLAGDAFAAFIDAERRRWTPVLRAVLQGTPK